jgi:hypothetical protein
VPKLMLYMIYIPSKVRQKGRATQQAQPCENGPAPFPPHGYVSGTLQCTPVQNTGVRGPTMHPCECLTSYQHRLQHKCSQQEGMPAYQQDTVPLTYYRKTHALRHFKMCQRTSMTRWHSHTTPQTRALRHLKVCQRTSMTQRH